jgi:hypothetical protein
MRILTSSVRYVTQETAHCLELSDGIETATCTREIGGCCRMLSY